MAGKMSPKFVALCSLAVGAIYSSGYSITANGSTALSAPRPQQSQAALASNNTASSSNNHSNSGSSGQSSHSGGSQGSQGSQNPTDTSGSGTNTNSNSNSNSSASNSSSRSTQPASTAAKPTKPAQKYLDGTYNGSASNRIGMVSVAVQISQGKIANVQITACDTHYPENYIDPVLPDYVLSHQTTNIPVVSGATLSTEDFYYAVVQALSQAQNPNYKG